MEQNKLVAELESLKENFDATIKYALRDARRQEKIMVRSDQRQRREYDELQAKLEEIQALNAEIEESKKEVLFTMGAIGESRSRETFNHVRRVSEYSKLIALKLGVKASTADLLKMASPMHDIGKVGIPDEILKKPGKLTSEEFEVMKTHVTFGYA